MTTGTYTALATDKKGVQKTMWIEAEHQQEAEHKAQAEARKRGLKYIFDSVDFDESDENNNGITF